MLLDSAPTVESAGPLTSDVVVLASAVPLPAVEAVRPAVGASLQQLSSATIKYSLVSVLEVNRQLSSCSCVGDLGFDNFSNMCFSHTS